MSVGDSESRRFELNIWLSFSQADLGPTSGQDFFFSFFFWNVWTFFLKIWAHGERHRNLMAGIFESLFFFWQHHVSIVIGLSRPETCYIDDAVNRRLIKTGPKYFVYIPPQPFSAWLYQLPCLMS